MSARHTVVTDGRVLPGSWQAYGYYADEDGRPMWATAVRASNAYMARAAVLERTHPRGPVVTYLKPIEPRTL